MYWCSTSHHFPFYFFASVQLGWMKKKVCVDALLLLLLMCVIAFRYVYVIASVSCTRLVYFFFSVSLFPTSTSNQTKININWLYRFCFPLGGFFYSIARHSYTSTTFRNTLFCHFERKTRVWVCSILLLLFCYFSECFSSAAHTVFFLISLVWRFCCVVYGIAFFYIYISFLSVNCISWLRIWAMQLNAKLPKCYWLCSVYV